MQFGERVDLFEVVLERVMDEICENRRRTCRGHGPQHLLRRSGFPTGSSGFSGGRTTSKSAGTSRAFNHSAAVSIDTPKGHQPSARVSARRSERLVRPPTQIHVRLQRAGIERQAAKRVELTLVGRFVGRQRNPQRPQGVVAAGSSVVERCTEQIELLPERTDSDNGTTRPLLT